MKETKPNIAEREREKERTWRENEEYGDGGSSGEEDENSFSVEQSQLKGLPLHFTRNTRRKENGVKDTFYHRRCKKYKQL